MAMRRSNEESWGRLEAINYCDARDKGAGLTVPGRLRMYEEVGFVDLEEQDGSLSRHREAFVVEGSSPEQRIMAYDWPNAGDLEWCHRLMENFSGLHVPAPVQD